MVKDEIQEESLVAKAEEDPNLAKTDESDDENDEFDKWIANHMAQNNIEPAIDEFELREIQKR